MPLGRGPTEQGGGLRSTSMRLGDRAAALHRRGHRGAQPGGGPVGLDRLLQLAERHSAEELPAPEVLRRVSHAVLDHQHGRLDDDATLMIVEWAPGAGTKMVP